MLRALGQNPTEGDVKKLVQTTKVSWTLDTAVHYYCTLLLYVTTVYYYCTLVIIFTSRTIILGFYSSIEEGFMPSPFSNGVPEINLSLLVWDDKRMTMCGKALGVSW